MINIKLNFFIKKEKNKILYLNHGLLDFQVILKYFEQMCLPLILQEFMLLSDSTVSASLEEKLRWAFKIYDKDMSGGYINIFYKSKAIQLTFSN